MQIAGCTSLDKKEKNGDFPNLNNLQQHHSFFLLFLFFASLFSRLMLPLPSRCTPPNHTTFLFGRRRKFFSPAATRAFVPWGLCDRWNIYPGRDHRRGVKRLAYLVQVLGCGQKSYWAADKLVHCMAQLGYGRKVAECETNAQVKKGVCICRRCSGLQCRVSIKKAISSPCLEASYLHWGRKVFRKRLTSTTVPGHTHLIAFLLLHGKAPFIGRTGEQRQGALTWPDPEWPTWHHQLQRLLLLVLCGWQKTVGTAQSRSATRRRCSSAVTVLISLPLLAHLVCCQNAK